MVLKVFVGSTSVATLLYSSSSLSSYSVSCQGTIQPTSVCYHFSANCKAQDVFAFDAFREKYGKNSKPAFLKAMTEAVAAIENGEGGDNKETTLNKRSRVSMY